MPAFKRYRHNGQYMQNTMTTWPNQYIGSGHSQGMFDAATTAQHYANLCVELPDQFDPAVTDVNEQLRLICEHETRVNDQAYKQAFAIAFGVPVEEITVEYSAWDGRDETIPYASDNSAPVQRIPEEQREGYVAPEPVPPTPLEIIANAILTDAGTSTALKEAARAAIVAGGEVVSDKIVPMVPRG